MNSSTKISLLVVVLAAAIFVLAAQFVMVHHQTIRQLDYTTNTGELTREVLVGQTFTSEHDNLSAIAVLFATYSNRRNTAPIQFHLRESFDATVDVRTAKVAASTLGDNQLHRFEFEPIPDSKGKTFFFFVVSPDSYAGNAVTVDLDTRNPYHLGTAFVARGQGNGVFDPPTITRSGKPTQDIGFAVYHTVPLRTAALINARQAAHRFIVTWAQQRSSYRLIANAALPAGLFLIFLYFISRHAKQAERGRELTSRSVVIILGGLVLCGILIRLYYAASLPVTDDEGNYLYDAAMLRQGIVAGGDGYVKAPVMIAWVSLWQALLGNSVLAGRASSVVIGVLTVFPMYFLGRQLKNRYTGLMTAAAWALFGAPVLAHVYVHTQPVALFFGISGLALVWSALGQFREHQAPTPFHVVTLATWRLVVGGMLLGLGVASRKSVVALGVVPLLLVITHLPTWRERARAVVAIGVGFAIVIAVFLGVAYWGYGTVGVYEAIGLASAEDGQVAPEASEVAKVRAYSLRGMTPFFREGLPLILLSLLGWGYLLETALRNALRAAFNQKPKRLILVLVDHVVPKILWVLPLLAWWWAKTFFFEYEGEAFMFFGIPALWYAMGLTLLGAAGWPRPRAEGFTFEERAVAHSTQPPGSPPNVVGTPQKTGGMPSLVISPSGPALFATLFLLPAWFGGLAFFYVNWIKFHANYINEFVPPLVVYAGVGSLVVWQRFSTPYWVDAQHPFLELCRKVLGVALLIVIGWSIFVTSYITYLYEHTGTFHQGAATQAATWARENIPPDQPIFTGAALIPYLSGHQTALNIAHPRWYAYEFTRKDPERLNTFLPAAEEMVQAFQNSQWFLLEKQTGFSFLMEYSAIEQGLARDFVMVKGIENGSNTLTFYRRK